VLSDYRRVLDWQLDLLDHNQLHNSVTVYYTLQLTATEILLFLGRLRIQLCNQLLWRPLPSLVITNSLQPLRCRILNCLWLTEDSSYIASGPDPKENASIVVLAVVCCVFICPLLSNGCLTSVSTADCWLGPLLSNGRKQACMSQYIFWYFRFLFIHQKPFYTSLTHENFNRWRCWS
jgi:hypothetical protein